MDPITFRAFIDEVEKIAMEAPQPTFRSGAMPEIGPAVGAILGAGIANSKGVSPAAGASVGAALGALPEIGSAVWKHLKASKARVH